MTEQRTDKKILLINGPNLNLLGTREPQTYVAFLLKLLYQQTDQRSRHHPLSSHRYGSTTLDDIEAECKRLAQSTAGTACLAFQSNHEGAIVDRIHTARTDGTVGIVINAAAYTHTSVAIRDALVGVGIPFIEVHVSGVQSSGRVYGARVLLIQEMMAPGRSPTSTLERVSDTTRICQTRQLVLLLDWASSEYVRRKM